MRNFDFDMIVIGAGSAGIPASLTSNGMGKKTALQVSSPAPVSRAMKETYLNSPFKSTIAHCAEKLST